MHGRAFVNLHAQKAIWIPQVRRFGGMVGTSPLHAVAMVINQGDCVRLRLDERMYQVIAVDDLHNRCWLRPWPLHGKSTPVFEEDLGNVMVGLACPVPDHRHERA